MKLAPLAAASLAVTLAAGPAPAHAGARTIHTVEGILPTISPACYERMATVTMAYPREDGTLDAYMGSYRVVLDPALEAVMHAAPRADGPARGRIRLERADGERAWHLVSFNPDR